MAGIKLQYVVQVLGTVLSVPLYMLVLIALTAKGAYKHSFYAIFINIGVADMLAVPHMWVFLVCILGAAFLPVAQTNRIE